MEPLKLPEAPNWRTNYPFAYTVVIDNQYRTQYGGCYPSTQKAYNLNSQCPSNATPDRENSPSGVTHLERYPGPANRLGIPRILTRQPLRPAGRSIYAKAGNRRLWRIERHRDVGYQNQDSLYAELQPHG